MSDLPFPDLEVPPSEPPPAVQPTKKPRGWRFTLVIISLTAVCLGGVAATALVIRQFFQNPVETQVFELAIDEFMAAASRRDAQSAFTFLSQDGQKQIPRAKLEKMLSGRDFALFADYRSVHVTSFHSYSVKDGDNGQPAGEAVEVTGVIAYFNNYVGQIQAVLQKQDGEWGILSFEIKVPPAKYGGVSSG